MLSGRGKSYFLGDLLTKVIFANPDGAPTTGAAQQRKVLFCAMAVYAATALAALVSISGCGGISYLSNSKLISPTLNSARPDYPAHGPGNLVPEKTSRRYRIRRAAGLPRGFAGGLWQAR